MVMMVRALQNLPRRSQVGCQEGFGNEASVGVQSVVSGRTVVHDSHACLLIQLSCKK